MQQPAIVTPEAVVLELERASVASRATAWVIDIFVILGAFTVVSLIAALVLGVVGAPDWLAIVLLVFGLFFFLFGYACFMESVWRGRTLGKMAVGLRVVTTDGAPIRFRHAALRSMLGLVDFWLPPGGATAILTTLGSSNDQRLGDLVAGTIVLHERSVTGATAALWFTLPPVFEPFVASLDTSRLTNDDYRLARSYLLRSASLTPAARWSLSTQMVRRFARLTGTWPPPGMYDEWFLAAVVAAHQRRQLAVTTPASPVGSWPWSRWTPTVGPSTGPPPTVGTTGYAPPA